MKRLIQSAEFLSELHGFRMRIISILIMVGITLGVFSQSVLARNTYIITDGDTVVVHTSFATDPSTVLQEAGVKLGEADTITTQQDGDVSEIVVSRANLITLNNCGTLYAISTTLETVGDLLASYNIIPTETTVLSTSLTSRLYDGMEIKVSELTYGTEVVEESIPHSEITCAVSWLNEDQTRLVEGNDGLQRTTYQVVYEDGKAIRRIVEDATVIQPANDSVTFVGTSAASSIHTFSANPAAAAADNSTLKLLTTANGDVLHYTSVLSCEATAYTCEGSSWNTTATGTTARVGCIAVDPSIIPLGTKVYIETVDGSFIYGTATAEDTGGAIKGNIVDLYFDTEAECWAFGRRACNVYLLA